MQRSHPFVDWMKAIGLILIVYGHVAHASTVWIAPPIYIKQFGVTFFIFATQGESGGVHVGLKMICCARLNPSGKGNCG